MIYSAARRGPLPSLNALATLTLSASMLLIGIGGMRLPARDARRAQARPDRHPAGLRPGRHSHSRVIAPSGCRT
jgi:hypothetical protein